MDRENFDAEQDARIAMEAQRLVNEWSKHLRAQDNKRAASDLQNTVLDYMASEEVKALMVRAAVGHALTSFLFDCLVVDAMYVACKAEAAKTVDAMEQRRIESRNDNRIAQALAGRALH